MCLSGIRESAHRISSVLLGRWGLLTCPEAPPYVAGIAVEVGILFLFVADVPVAIVSCLEMSRDTNGQVWMPVKAITRGMHNLVCASMQAAVALKRGTTCRDCKPNPKLGLKPCCASHIEEPIAAFINPQGLAIGSSSRDQVLGARHAALKPQVKFFTEPWTPCKTCLLDMFQYSYRFLLRTPRSERMGQCIWTDPMS